MTLLLYRPRQSEVLSEHRLSQIIQLSATHGDVVEQREGGGAGAAAGGDVVRVASYGAALPLAAAVLSHRHHQALAVLQVHRPLDAVPGGSTGA